MSNDIVLKCVCSFFCYMDVTRQLNELANVVHDFEKQAQAHGDIALEHAYG